MSIAELRKAYHQDVCSKIIRQKKNKKAEPYPNFADASSKGSIRIAWGIVTRIGCSPSQKELPGQTTGTSFENATKDFVERAFAMLYHLRPGKWQYSTGQQISHFDQYAHLANLAGLAQRYSELASTLGSDYIIKPDIVIGRSPVPEEEINARGLVVSGIELVATKTPLRETNSQSPILHASISCKWTIRSDRAQNPRTEALNLIRNRKGSSPHIVVVTAEPLPMRIASIALGTGDLDCVYHFALPELEEAIREVGNEDQLDMLNTLVQGRRLRDISDLPFDLAA